MDVALLLLAFFAATWLSAAGAWVAWRRGWKLAVLLALLVVAGFVGLFFYLSTIASGSYLAGLGEMLVAVGLAAGPGVGLIIGVIAAYSMPVGIGCAVLHLCILALTLADSL